MLADYCFWLSIAVILYAYVGYPLQLLIQARLFPRPVTLAKHTTTNPRTISVVVAARNEEQNIGKRIENLLTQDYPHGLMEILIVSDGSHDATGAIVERFTKERTESDTGKSVKLISYAPGRGKSYAMNRAVSEARGEIIVFADARQSFKTDTVKSLVDRFADPSIGCISGELVFTETTDSEIQAEAGAYWKYEKLIRKLESETGSVVGATGAIYAIRKELFIPLHEDTILDDVVTPMMVAAHGKRVILDSHAIAFDVVTKDAGKEFRRKVRTLAGNWQLVGQHGVFMRPGGHPLWWRFLIHKIMRLIVPFLLPITLAASFWQASYLGHLFGWLQVSFYAVALFSAVFAHLRKIKLFGFCFFFAALNAAAVLGFFYWITGRHHALWRSS
jgi:poly-beta-1,6-N-acetyl-D-glucosamine synthase